MFLARSTELQPKIDDLSADLSKSELGGLRRSPRPFELVSHLAKLLAELSLVGHDINCRDITMPARQAADTRPASRPAFGRAPDW
jgi:hypothetical protein